ncbi:hypothetical protein E2C01_085844 [Portunus trituberculatus]|uniref:Uncharacterized protein n=1 Tax=Portunus trituberculatus TaxID=210409 RepID=A0A5B7IZ73_PORTR|nr:hypothetical protein [Portunus trituberculatus]
MVEVVMVGVVVSGGRAGGGVGAVTNARWACRDPLSCRPVVCGREAWRKGDLEVEQDYKGIVVHVYRRAMPAWKQCTSSPGTDTHTCRACMKRNVKRLIETSFKSYSKTSR